MLLRDINKSREVSVKLTVKFHPTHPHLVFAEQRLRAANQDINFVVILAKHFSENDYLPSRYECEDKCPVCKLRANPLLVNNWQYGSVFVCRRLQVTLALLTVLINI